jgi:hypothetical protein
MIGGKIVQPIRMCDSSSFFLKSSHVPQHPGGKTATFSNSAEVWCVVCCVQVVVASNWDATNVANMNAGMFHINR